MDMLDWTDGILVKQARQRLERCDGTAQLWHDAWSGAPTCLPELVRGTSDTAPFGYNHTHPSEPRQAPWRHFTAGEIGSNARGGISSAAIPSMEQYDADGYVAVAIPFFSDTWLDEESGPAANVTDHRLSAVTPTNNRVPRYFCVRLSTNGEAVRQLCDPTDNPADRNGRLTGAVRAAVELWWGDLKRGHFLDARTRLLSVVLQLRNNHLGLGHRITLLVEFTSQGLVLPSYDVETRVLSAQRLSDMSLFANLSLVLIVLFALLELIELLESSVAEYLSDMWNLMDWLNYAIFLLTYLQVLALRASIEEEAADCAASHLCREVGYFDRWREMGTNRQLKQFLSLSLSVQLFKIIKFASLLIPKLGHMTFVLRRTIVELAFFGIVFFTSVMSFSTMLYVQVGPFIEEYGTQVASVISLIRALFGDFDMDEIMNNSSGYINAVFLLGYLFVAVFIMLTLFISILAEGHNLVREVVAKRKADDGAFDEYGQLAVAARAASAAGRRLVERSPWLEKAITELAPAFAPASAPALAPALAPADAGEPLELSAGVDALKTDVASLGGAVEELSAALRELRAAPRPIRRPRPPPQARAPPLQPPPSPSPSRSNPLLDPSDPILERSSSLAADEAARAAHAVSSVGGDPISEAATLRRMMEALGRNVGSQLSKIDAQLEKRERRAAKLRAMDAADGRVSPAATGGTTASHHTQRRRRPRPPPRTLVGRV